MKTLCSIILCIGFLPSCGGNGNQKTSVAGTRVFQQEDSNQQTQNSPPGIEKGEYKHKNPDERNDSIRLEAINQVALRYADEHKGNKQWSYSFDMTPDDSSYTVTTTLDFGHPFDQTKKHLIVCRKLPWTALLDVYLLEKSKFVRVAHSSEQDLHYTGRQIGDVNGDGYKDLIAHWYPSAGCCLAAVADVYLYKPGAVQFTSGYRFLNARFFPAEKAIRGMEYGHPGEAGLYSFRWDGLSIDTIEYIYPYKSNFIRTKKPNYHPSITEGNLLNKLPATYQFLDREVLAWFLGKK